MKHSAFLRRFLLLVYGAILLFALLILAIYNIVSPQIYAQDKIMDLTAKGRIIAEYIDSMLQGEIPSNSLIPLIGRNTTQWEATVWVVDLQGDTLMRTQQINGRPVGKLPATLTAPMLRLVQEGRTATHIGTLEDLQTEETRSSISLGISASSALRGIARQDSSSDHTLEEDLGGSIVAVAVPIMYWGQVVGAVFMAQSMTEVISGMQALTNTISFSLIAVALLMLPVVLFLASRMSRPLRNMRTVALTMASGDLLVRADDSTNDEFGELGGALNHLSSELGRTISSLEMERNRLRSLINGLSEGIIAVDADGNPLLINPAVFRLLSLPDDIDSVRTNAPDVFALFDRCIRTHETVIETLWIDSIALRVSIAPLHQRDGVFTGCVGILSDVTSAERLEQTRRDYVANVSHELRTPLTAMRALLEPLRDGLIRTEDQKQQTYETVLRETMRLSRLVNDMLELSRLQSGNTSLTRSRFSPLPLLSLIYETYSAYAEDYQQTFIYDVPEALPHVIGNPDRTQQVLIALLDNAFKYTPEGGTVTLRAAVEDDVIRVTVSDTGIGIGKEDLPHVFDRFYKADKSHHGRGTGLGLAIAYEIMKNLGESMSVESAPGKGSAFSFTLHIE
ncbi:MAG: HAMP domain-containing protein [Clostridia bacterium]|nr:HAMP domain-containing protein [Clostridia bacterium]